MRKFTAFITVFIVLMTFALLPSAHAGNPFSAPLFYAEDGTGRPLAGGWVYTYKAGTNTPKAAYTNRLLTIEASNPIELDSEGKAVFYLGGIYKINLKDADEVQQANYPIDDVQGVYQAGDSIQRYYVDATEADQGVAGSGFTVYDLVEAIGGTKFATLVFARTDDNNNTDYIFLTHETIPGNIKLEFENGARLAPGAAIIVTVESPEHILAASTQEIKTGGGTLVYTTPGTDYIKRRGTTAAAIGETIDAANGGTIKWTAGTYSLTTVINKTFTAAQVWESEGPVTISWDGGVVDNMITLELAFSDFTMKGPFTLDGNDTARGGLRINNATTDMDTEAVDIHLTDIHAFDFYSVTAGQSSQGIQVIAGANLVTFERIRVWNVSRDSGVGVPGSQGSAGISVANTGINRYAKQVVVIDAFVENVTSEEADGAANNVDADCLVVTGPNATAHPDGFKVDTVLIVRGGWFENCRGRSIKSQVEYNVVDGATFVRGGTGDRSITDGMEVDFQFGSGILRNFKAIYSELTGLGGPSPFGGSFKIANATVAAHSTTEGAFIVSGGLVVNNADATLYTMPYAFTLALGGDTFRSVVIEDVIMLGVGRVSQFIRGVSLATLESLRVNGNYISNMTTALIYTTSDASSCMAEVTGNTLGTGAAELLVAFAGDVPIASGHGNSGFPVNLTSVGNTSPQGEILRPVKIMPAGGEQGGAIVTESVALADDGLHTFSQRNYQTGIGMYFISVNFNDKMQGVFAADTDTITDLTGGAATAIDYGNVADPDAGCTAGSILNVWIDGASDSISIHNCIGSTRIITLVSIG